MPTHAFREELLKLTHEGATAIGTTLQTLDFDTVETAAPGFTYSAGEITVGPSLDDRSAMVDVAVSVSTTANQDCNLRVELQRDSGSGWLIDRAVQNMAITSKTVDRGTVGLNGWPVLLIAGDKYRVQVLRDGAAATTVPKGTWLSMRTT